MRAVSVDRDPGAAARAAHRSLPGATVDVQELPGRTPLIRKREDGQFYRRAWISPYGAFFGP